MKTTLSRLFIGACCAAGLLAATACSDPAAPGDSLPGGGDAGLAGSVNGEPITHADLIEILTVQQYDLMRSAVKAIATNRLIDSEAEARGITADELFTQEVTEKVPQPTDDDVRMFYDARKNTPRLKDKTLEEARGEISEYLLSQALTQRHADFLNELRAAGNIRVLLDAPRFDVAVPLGTPSKGDENAPITIVEFADFQCPACRKAYPAMERLLGEYGDRVRFVFRDFPLPSHPRSVPASEAAACAGEQDRFWDYYQNLMLMQGSLSDADLKNRAASLDMDTAAFEACFAAGRYSGEVEAAFQEGRTLGVNSTPTFFINGRRMVGFPSYEEAKTIIEEELARVAG